MNFRQYLLAIITGLFVLFNFSCAKISSSGDSEVVFDDGYQKQAKKNEITIDDLDFRQTSQLSTKREAHEETPIQLKDGSILTVTYDAFGNKTEKREFPGDSRLLMLSITTSADGKQEIMVWGRNLERKSLPPEMLDRVLTTDANEIAQTAGIFERYREVSIPSLTTMQEAAPKQSYQQMQLPPVPQIKQEIVNQENSPIEQEQKPAEQKVEESPQPSPPLKDSAQADFQKGKDINNKQ